MRIWEIEGRYRGDGYGEREEIERKMREAYECGYEDAKREMRDGYGERHTGGYMPDGYGERGGEYGSDGYGERRGVRGTGPYSRFRR
ncbi:hypothetical protein [Alistipes putredinis]|jgi:hypothetical protein|uniref:hypothetical protein n=1 Tax=Alistipes putredinis TaxID=28117 RepID=UPI0024203F26|nr:hypothetical protein [Alistipes putredinis]